MPCGPGGTCVQLMGRVHGSTMSLRGFAGHGCISSREKAGAGKTTLARELARTLPEWCFAAPHPAAPSNISSPKSALPWSASRGDTRIKALNAECAAAGFADT